MVHIEVTEKAKTELAGVMAENADKAIRLFIQGAGWGGPRLGMALDEPTENDSTVTANGISFIYSKEDEPHISDSIIDFEDSYMGKGFSVRNSVSNCC